MDKKELSLFITFIGLSVLFAIAATALYLSKGRSKFWTAKKMKFGAILLTITAATTFQSCDDGTTMCYETVLLKDRIVLNTQGNEIDLKTIKEIKGKIEYRSSEIYSFYLKNDSLTENFSKGLLIPVDGKFNDSIEFFSLELDASLEPGNYTLSFFDTTINAQKYSIADYGLILKSD